MPRNSSIAVVPRPSAPVTACTRLRNDYANLVSDPVPYVVATPDLDNILEWYYVLVGPEDTHYEGGYYFGRLKFPSEYPFKPPSIMMMTPNGRFKCHTRLCLSMSDYHPETWNPSWSTSTILTGLLSFMLEEQPAIGCITSTPQEKRQFAAQSFEFNLTDKKFCELFPDLAKEFRDKSKTKSVEAESTTTGSHDTR